MENESKAGRHWTSFRPGPVGCFEPGMCAAKYRLRTRAHDGHGLQRTARYCPSLRVLPDSHRPTARVARRSQATHYGIVWWVFVYIRICTRTDLRIDLMTISDARRMFMLSSSVTSDSPRVKLFFRFIPSSMRKAQRQTGINIQSQTGNSILEERSPCSPTSIVTTVHT